jgi:hypothetical protein
MNNPVLSLPLDLVVVADRLRPVNADYVELIAASMGERGQDTPIKVGPPDAEGRHRLIAGGHRVAAAQALGWDKIDAIVTEATGLQAELIEVDENLMRRELNALDRAVFLAKRQAIYEALHPQAAHGKAPKGKDRKLATFSPVPSFRAETAARIGLDETSINRIIRRAQLVRDNPGLHLALSRHPVADSGAELDRLREQGRKGSDSWTQMLMAHRWLPRDDEKVPQGVKPQVAVAMASSPVLTKLVAMREELRQLWTRTNVSREQLVSDLQAWCQRAEESGIAALQEMALRVKAARI